MSAEYDYVPVVDATTPRDGEAIANRWWIVHPERGVVFYRTGKRWAPQCNSNEHITRSLAKRHHPDCTVQLIPVVFIPWGKSMRSEP